MAFMSPHSLAHFHASAVTEEREAYSADENSGSVVVPMPFDLSIRDREDYFRSVLSPPAPPEPLRSALAEYRQYFAK